MREVSGAELADLLPDPFVRHQVDPATLREAWVHDGAAVLRTAPHLPGARGDVVTLLGRADALAGLAGHVAARTPTPWRLTVPAAALDAVPPLWRHREARRWHWMLTTGPVGAPDPGPDAGPDPGPGPEHGAVLEDVTDPDEVDAVLDAGAPDAHARPGSPGLECWLGLRRDGRLEAVGALARQADGTGHLRAVTVLPDARGRGLGRALSVALTERALAGRSGTATLGVYVDNDPATAIYRGLGYAVVHTFASGPVGG